MRLFSVHYNQQSKYPNLIFCTILRGLLGKDVPAKMFSSHKVIKIVQVNQKYFYDNNAVYILFIAKVFKGNSET